MSYLLCRYATYTSELVGKTSLLLDKKILNRIEDIEALNEDGKSFVLRVLDMALRDINTQKAYASS